MPLQHLHPLVDGNIRQKFRCWTSTGERSDFQAVFTVRESRIRPKSNHHHVPLLGVSTQWPYYAWVRLADLIDLRDEANAVLRWISISFGIHQQIAGPMELPACYVDGTRIEGHLSGPKNWVARLMKVCPACRRRLRRGTQDTPAVPWRGPILVPRLAPDLVERNFQVSRPKRLGCRHHVTCRVGQVSSPGR